MLGSTTLTAQADTTATGTASSSDSTTSTTSSSTAKVQALRTSTSTTKASQATTTATTGTDATNTTANTDSSATSGAAVSSSATKAVSSSNAQSVTKVSDSAQVTNATTTTATKTVTATSESAKTTQPAQATSNTVAAQAKVSVKTTAVATSQAVTKANTAVTDGGNVEDDYPDLHNMLGISSQFHIFAREAELNAHTNGNIAVGTLSGNVNFGTNIIEELLDKDISYIQNVDNIASSSFVSAGDTRINKVIFGENVTIDISNPDRPKINGVDIDHLLASEVYQDKDGNLYIDFDAEFAKLEKLSASLSEQTPNKTYSNDDFEDMNQRVIDVTGMEPDADGHIVINLSADVLNASTPLTIKGLSADADGNTVIINVDTAGEQDYHVNSQIKIIYDDGSDRNNKETEDFGDNHLLWNFYDSTASDKLATGTISVDRPFQGSILAPAAEIDANQNIDGNLIANKVNVKAETHRWDLQDNVDNEKDGDYERPVPPIIDIDLPEIDDGYEKPVPPTIDVEMPNIDEGEDGYEKPVPPTIDVEMPNIDEGEDGYEKPVPPTIDVEMPNVDDLEEEIEDGVDPDEIIDQIEDEIEEDLQDNQVTDETVEEMEIDFEEIQKETVSEQIKDGQTLLGLIDQAIAQAEAHHNQALVDKLTALRAQVASALAVAQGKVLPQTSESTDHSAVLAGVLLASALALGAYTSRRKQRN